MRLVITGDNAILACVASAVRLLKVVVDRNRELAIAVPCFTIVAGTLVALHDRLISHLNRYSGELELVKRKITRR